MPYTQEELQDVEESASQDNFTEDQIRDLRAQEEAEREREEAELQMLRDEEERLRKEREEQEERERLAREQQQREAELAAAVAAEQNEKRRTVDVLQAQLADTEANMEHERKLAVDLAAKLSSAEEMLTNVIGINEYLVRQRSENVRKDAKVRFQTRSFIYYHFL